jgi:hypothetical protein
LENIGGFQGSLALISFLINYIFKTDLFNASLVSAIYLVKKKTTSLSPNEKIHGQEMTVLDKFANATESDIDFPI